MQKIIGLFIQQSKSVSVANLLSLVNWGDGSTFLCKFPKSNTWSGVQRCDSEQNLNISLQFFT